jgi:DNA ligase-1
MRPEQYDFQNVPEPNTEEVFRETTSFVMSHDKVGKFSFYVFDVLPAYPEQPYNARKGVLEGLSLPGNTKVLQQTLIASKDDLEAFRSNAVEQGYEGAMIKAPEGKYKYGRSSVKEGLLLKLKLFKDEEFKIVGFECKYHNANEAKTNELGRTARSTSKEGMIPVDTLGVLYLSTKDGVEFGCGSGFDDATRKELWEQRESLVGKYATVKYFDQGGYDVPRHPVFKGIRDEIDFKE